MSPTTAQNNLGNRCLLKAVFPAQCELTNPSFCVSAPYFSNLFSSNQRATVIFSTLSAALCYLVCRIVSVRSSEDVFRIHAGRIIAGMTTAKAVRNGTINQFPRVAMRSCGGMGLGSVKRAIAVFIGPARPLPAVAIRAKARCFINAKPEAFKLWNLATGWGAKLAAFLLFSFWPRMKRDTASFAKLCYFKSSQDVNLLHRFMNWSGSFGVLSAARAVTILA